MPCVGLRCVVVIFLIIPRTLYLDRITLSWFIAFYGVGRDNWRSFSGKLTSQNRINGAGYYRYNPFIRNNNLLNPFIIANNDQLSFNHRIYFFHKFSEAAF